MVWFLYSNTGSTGLDSNGKRTFFSGMLWYSLSTELTYLTSSLLLIARRYSDNLIYSMIMSIGIISLKSRSKGIILLKL